MNWLSNLELTVDAATLSAALLAGVLGTALLLLLRSRAAMKGWMGSWQKLLAAFSSLTTEATKIGSEKAGSSKVKTAPSAVTAEESAPKIDEPSGADAADAPTATVTCPPELSRRIDRIEAKVRARSARRSG